MLGASGERGRVQIDFLRAPYLRSCCTIKCYFWPCFCPERCAPKAFEGEICGGRRRIKSEARSDKKKKIKMGRSDKKIRHRGEIGLWAEMMRSIEDQGFYFWRRDLEILLLVLAGL